MAAHSKTHLDICVVLLELGLGGLELAAHAGHDLLRDLAPDRKRVPVNRKLVALGVHLLPRALQIPDAGERGCNLK